jgi:hypothetical protein
VALCTDPPVLQIDKFLSAGEVAAILQSHTAASLWKHSTVRHPASCLHRSLSVLMGMHRIRVVVVVVGAGWVL